MERFSPSSFYDLMVTLETERFSPPSFYDFMKVALETEKFSPSSFYDLMVTLETERFSPPSFYDFMKVASETERFSPPSFYDFLKVALETPSEQPVASHETMTRDYPRFSDIHDLNPDQLHPRTVLDVTPYMNHSSYSVNPETSVPRVFHLFRSMGLRHLPVVDTSGDIVGMITRHDLTHEYLEMVHKEHRNH